MLAVLGATGLTAYVGIVDVGAAQEGETVVVSAAAGATGSLAAQIAKLRGCRVIGICGSDDKARWLVEDLGLDGAINRRTEDVHARLKELCPDRIDVCFDNVGGPILDAVLDRLAMHARVALCGAIAVYNEHGRPPGPSNYFQLINRRARMEGFLSLDHWDRFPEVEGPVGVPGCWWQRSPPCCWWSVSWSRWEAVTAVPTRPRAAPAPETCAQRTPKTPTATATTAARAMAPRSHPTRKTIPRPRTRRTRRP